MLRTARMQSGNLLTAYSNNLHYNLQEYAAWTRPFWSMHQGNYLNEFSLFAPFVCYVFAIIAVCQSACLWYVHMCGGAPCQSTIKTEGCRCCFLQCAMEVRTIWACQRF